MDNVSPTNGSIISDFEGAQNATTLMCDVFTNGLQITTQWNIENFRGNTQLQEISPDMDLFLLTGDELPSDLSLTFHNHLVIQNLTAELDGVIIHCGTGQDPQQASFRLRIYSMVAT